MRRAILFIIAASLIICQAHDADSAGIEATDATKNGGSVYEYDENDMPEVFFFPPEKARWDGTKVTIREWYMLTEEQKKKFITEYLSETSKAYRSPIDIIGSDYLRALNMFSYFSGQTSAAEPTTKVIDKILAGQGKVSDAVMESSRAVTAHSPAEKTAFSAVKIVVQVGDEFTIALVSNPTTGYGWQLKEPYRKDIIELISTQYLPDRTGLTGSGGREVRTFRATGEGVTSITLIYKRPWEKNEAPVRETRFVIAILPAQAPGAGDE